MKTQRPVNIKSLAKELNLAISTVSKALRDSHEVKEETKKKVWALAKKRNYQPNAFAAGLRAQKSNTIAVIFPELANSFFSLAIKGIEEVAKENNYHVLIYPTHECKEQEIAFTNRLLDGRVDGVMISLSRGTTNYDHLITLNQKVPIVLFDRIIDEIDILKVTTNDYESAFIATEHLIKNGCKEILYLEALKFSSTGKMRLRGHLEALKSYNIPYDKNLILNCDQCDQKTRFQIKRVLSTSKPRGILSSIENLATHCYDVCKELSIMIPKDIKIVSFSNLETAHLWSPALTTIKQPAFEIGKEAAKILFQILNKKQFDSEFRNIVLESTFIQRGSSTLVDKC
jgi:LacI family transcriptional regulator